jgi:hypothetical protein
MTYITWSRKLEPSKLTENICKALASVIPDLLVVRRGVKSIDAALRDARSKGHSRVILLSSAKGGLVGARIASIESDLSFRWTGKYALGAKGRGPGALRVTRDGENEDAKEEFISKAKE